MSEDEEFEFRARAEQEAQAKQNAPLVTQEGPQPSKNIGVYAAQAATPAATQFGAAAARGALNAPLTSVTAPLTSPIQTARNVAQAVENVIPRVSETNWHGPAGQPIIGSQATRAMTVGEGLAAAGRGVGNALMAPENLMTLPYNMAAYEQAKIRANPNAPEYANNPYAMVQRGQAPTQNIAGAMNQRAAVQNYATGGNPMPGTPQFAQLQAQQDAQAQQALANPNAGNFLERMKYYSKKYGGIGQ